MRISLQPGDAGYRVPATFSCRVFLDGEEVQGVVTADEEQGYLQIRSDNPSDPTGPHLLETKFGQVEIRDFHLMPVPELERLVDAESRRLRSLRQALLQRRAEVRIEGGQPGDIAMAANRATPEVLEIIAGEVFAEGAMPPDALVFVENLAVAVLLWAERGAGKPVENPEACLAILSSRALQRYENARQGGGGEEVQREIAGVQPPPPEPPAPPSESVH